MSDKESIAKAALHCLYIVVDEKVAKDINVRVNAYILELKDKIKLLEPKND